MRHLFFLVLLWSLAVLPARAAETVQIQLRGNVLVGGGTVEIELDGSRRSDGELSRVRMNLFFAESTGGADVLAVLRMHLARENWACAAAPADAGQPASLVLGSVERVLVRTGNGLLARVTVCDGVPAALSVLVPEPKASDALLEVSANSWNQRMREQGLLQFRTELKSADGAIGAAQALLTATGKAQWISETPSRESWRLAPSMEGRELTGVSFACQPVQPQSAWGLELRLK